MRLVCKSRKLKGMKDKEKLPAYYCSNCKTAVIVVPNEKPIKACNCSAPIAANMEGTVYSVAKMKG